MSTRGILAVVDGDDLLGVFHNHDSYPWKLGNRVLIELRRRAGDLGGMLRDWIREAPGGWHNVGETRREPDWRDEPPFYRRADFRSLGWIDYFYLLDEDVRTLRIWGSNPADGDRWNQPEWVGKIAADGRCDPPVIETPEPVWHDLPVLAGWEGDTDEACRQRAAFAVAIRDRVGDVAGYARRVEQALSDSLSACTWRPNESPEEAELRALLGMPRPPPTTDDETLRAGLHAIGLQYWAVRIGPHKFCTATGGRVESRHLSGLFLYRPGGARTYLKLEEALPGEMFAVLAEAAAIAIAPGDLGYDRDRKVLWRFRTVVPNGPIRHPELEIPLADALQADPACSIGDSLGFEEDMPPLQWLVPEWLRTFQVPQP
jgi:hypothetical protein